MKPFIGIAAIAATIAGTAALALIAGVSAHAQYESSTPAAGAVLTTAPTSVVINFQEDIQTTFGSFGITVVKDGGGSVTSGAATASGDKQLTVPLVSGISDGRYVVNWNNTSADDGDPLSGAFAFYMNTQPTAAQLAADQQLAAVEGNQLATATAEASSQATETAQAGAPAPTVAASTPAAAAPTSAAAAAPTSRAALPSTGTGSSRDGNASLWMVAAFVLAGGAVVSGGLALRSKRR